MRVLGQVMKQWSATEMLREPVNLHVSQSADVMKEVLYLSGDHPGTLLDA
jgi:hypothetical protein